MKLLKVILLRNGKMNKTKTFSGQIQTLHNDGRACTCDRTVGTAHGPRCALMISTLPGMIGGKI